MTGRVWRSRTIRRGDYEVEVDGRVAVFVSLQGGVELPSLLMSRIVATVAEPHGDAVAGTPGVNWVSLGWNDQAEHDALVGEIGRIVRSWSGRNDELHLVRYVNTRKAEQGIPSRPPYSVTQADELDRIVRRAPAVVAQDLAAEGTAA